MIRPAVTLAAAACLLVSSAGAVDRESFFFGDANDTPLTMAANTANTDNFWFYDEEATTPGDETTGDISTVQAGGYRIITNSALDTGLESRFLDIDNVSSGQVYLSATFSDWDFGAYDLDTIEEFRLTFLDDDTGESGNRVTAQVRIIRNADTGAMQLVGDAIGTSGSHDIANTFDLPDTLSEDFTVVLALDKDSNSFEVFYRQGAGPSQALGLGGVSRVRDGNSIRMVTDNFGLENFLPFVILEEMNLDSLVLSDDNPLDDLLTLEVDRVTGAMTLINTSGASVTGVTGVTLESEVGAIDLTDFVDFSGTLSDGQSAALDAMPAGAPGLWVRHPVEDVRAELSISGGDPRTVDVNFVGNGGVKWLDGDLNFNGVIDEGDYAILAANAESVLAGTPAETYQFGDLNGDGLNDVTDFTLFKSRYIAANGQQAFNELIAGVPEPATAGLGVVGLVALSLFRRERRARLTPVDAPQCRPQCRPMKKPLTCASAAILASLVWSASANHAEAIIFEEFLFDDSAGTSIQDSANNVNSGNNFDADAQSDSMGVVTNGIGQLDLHGKNNDEFGTHYVDLDPFTSGVLYGVMELTWDFQSALDTTQNEELRITFQRDDPRTTFTTAEFQIIRDDSNQMVALGQANGTGSTDFASPVPLVGVGLTQSEKFLMVLKADLTNREYELLYSSNGGSSFNSAGTGSISPDRNIESIRLGLNNDFVNDNVLIDRFYVADELPVVVEPDLLKLLVHPESGHVAIVNSTGTSFEIDHYRITSGDDSLVPGSWFSLQDQALDAVDGPDGGTTAGDGTGETWTQAGGSGAGVLSESFLLGSSEFAGGDVVLLGDVVSPSSVGGLTFEYRDAATGTVFTGEVELGELGPGDFNLDGVVDIADFTVWRDDEFGGFGGPSTTSYVEWRSSFGATYSALPLQTALTAAPEPSALVTAVLLLLAGWPARALKLW